MKYSETLGWIGQRQMTRSKSTVHDYLSIYVIICLAMPDHCSAQQGYDPLVGRILACLSSSDGCTLNLDVQSSVDSCEKFALTELDGTPLAECDLVYEPSLLAHEQVYYEDTWNSVLLSYQLSRYGESALRSESPSSRTIRFVCINEVGLLLLHVTCIAGRCKGRLLSDTTNRWILEPTIQSIIQAIDVSERRLIKELGNYQVRISPKAGSPDIFGQFLIFEERSAAGLRQERYFDLRKNRRAFVRMIRRLVRSSR